MTPAGEARAGVAAHLCPLCGLANGCAMAAGSRTECWCVGAAFGADLRRRAAGAGGAARCICARCASDAAQSAAMRSPDTR
jgi:hypothetical protein